MKWIVVSLSMLTSLLTSSASQAARAGADTSAPPRRSHHGSRPASHRPEPGESDPDHDTPIDESIWIAGIYDTLPYRILYPVGYDPSVQYPLIVFLHGSGESGDDNLAQVSNGVQLFATADYQSEFPAIVVAPQCPDDDSWGGYLYQNKSTATQSRVLSLVKELVAKLSVDSHRIYITGLSMGGIGTWDIVWRFPGVFAAALPIAGSADPATVNDLMQVPIWAFHGSNDRNVPPTEDRIMYRLISQHGGIERYTEYPGVAHNAWDRTYADKSVIQWLFSQRLP